MSYLERLKAELAAEPSVGFVGAPSTPVLPYPLPLQGSVSSVGARREGVWPFRSPSISETPLPLSLTEPTKAPADLYVPQADPNRCHVCGEREEPGRLFIAVLTDRPGAHHWLHHDCHAEHSRRCAERRAT